MQLSIKPYSSGPMHRTPRVRYVGLEGCGQLR